MRDLVKIATECMKELDELGIEYSKSIKFSINTRAKNRWGQTRHMPDGSFDININAILLDERTPIMSCKNTVMHELLHTCEDCCNHKWLWKDYADRVNKRFGYNIKRTTTAEEKGIANLLPEEIAEYKYKIQCQKCGLIHSTSILSKSIKYPELYRCTKCNGKFIRIA